ncbi:hypothetical protein RB195_014364 [Necator americanus]|uniref:Uncharacterized protein n=1 Tax=Necator americanus TaxID=51031 RepID=A0ABR1E052_NECAM
MVNLRMTRGEHQHLARPSEVVVGNHHRFFGHVMRRSSGRFVQLVLRMLTDANWKGPPGRKRKFWTEVVKEDLRTSGVDGQFIRDVKFRCLWNSDGRVDSMRPLVEDRTGLVRICSRTTHPGDRIAALSRYTRSPIKSR